MDLKRTMTMNWDGLDEEDDFFDTTNRISAVVPMDMLGCPYDDSSDEDEFEDPRMSFSSVVSLNNGGHTHSATITNVCGPTLPLPSPVSTSSNEEYDIWMAAPTSIEDRRRRLLHGMGLNSNKELVRIKTMAMSQKISTAAETSPSHPPHSLPLTSKVEDRERPHETTSPDNNGHDHDHDTATTSPSPDNTVYLVRSRSDSDIDQFSIETRRRKEHLIGDISKQRLTRTLSTFASFTRVCKMSYDDGNSCTTSGTSTSTSSTTTTTTASNDKSHDENNVGHKEINNDHENKNLNANKKKNAKNGKKGKSNQQRSGIISNVGEQLGAFFLIKNLDTGKEFIVKEFAEDGMWNRLSEVQTGRQLTLEEFEKSVGYSPVVKELMRRQNQRLTNSGAAPLGLERKTSVNAYLSKSLRNSKRRGVSILRNINKVAYSVTGLGGSTPERDPHHVAQTPSATQAHGQVQTQTQNQTATPVEQPKGGKSGNNNDWVRVRTQGKTYKELTALRFCQEIQAHQGSIWTIKFSFDGRYLASAGEDKVIHIWEVQECEIASLKPPEESVNSTPLHPMFCSSPDWDGPAMDKKKKGRSGSRRGSIMPDYVQLPETVFALSNEPVCTFQGHLDDVLDLSWSRSQLYLLSSSMDKTVRLWDLETKACLKLFAHNDYVTCIQFNPVNDDYFISGSLDAKVRIWSVPGRRVVDWTDLHEMVTAACYTPDGQGAAVGSHKGNCRMYNITDGKLNQTIQFDIQNKKKTAPKKITGFEFASDNPNEVLVTSADSRIRIYDGSEVTQKFRGFRNTSSQIAASFSPDGKYVICGSEDSNVYVWKREEPRNNGKTKTLIDTRSYEYFQCKDVSVAIPWPGSIKFDPPTIQLHAKKNTKKPPSSTSTSTSATNSPKKDDANKHNKRQHLPPLPHNKKNNNVTDKAVNKDNNKDNNNKDNNNSKDNNNTDNNSENMTKVNNRKDEEHDKNNSSKTNVEGEKAPDSPEADPAQISRTDSGIGDSFSSSTGASIRYDDSPSMTSNHTSSPSWAPGWSWFDGGASHGSETMQARAWGMVIVTAGLGGEIKAYQNIGLPLKVGRQSNLFLA